MARTIDQSLARASFSARSALTWLLTFNAAIFVALRSVAAVGTLSSHGAEWGASAVETLSLPASAHEALLRPWTWATYMFAQYDPSHLLFNMLWLAWFGMLFHERCGNRALITAYVAGGITGGAIFLLRYALLPISPLPSGLIGASAAVMSVAAAITVIEPDRRVELLFVGSVRLKWIAAAMIAIAIICFSGYHAGSDSAHAGGLIAGALFGLVYRRRKADSDTASTIAEATPTKAPRIIQPASDTEMTDTELLDSLLDKIRRSGYDSLTPTERTSLHAVSRRIDPRQCNTTKPASDQ